MALLCMPLYAAEKTVIEAQKHSLDIILGAQLLKAAKENTILSVNEKLNVYRCQMVKKYIGFDDTPLSQALKYSCSAPVVGVVFYAGKDLGHHSPEKIADYIKKEFSKYGMVARVFINVEHEFSSSVAYIIGGGKEVFDPVSPAKAIKNIKGFAADMKLVFFADKLITPNELEKWAKADAAYMPNLTRKDY